MKLCFYHLEVFIVHVIHLTELVSYIACRVNVDITDEKVVQMFC